VEKTKEEIEVAYKIARVLAKSLMARFWSSHDHIMALEDYIQEGILGWLEGRSMYRSMIRAFSNTAKMSNYSYVVKGMREPHTVPLDDYVENEHATENICAELDKQVDASKFLDRILAIQDDKAQFAVLGYFYFDMSLRDIGEVLEKSHEWVRTYLINPEIEKLREEFA